MASTFKKLKASRQVINLIKTAIMGVSLGLLTVGAMLLVFKLTKFDFPILYTILIGVGVGLVGAIATFLVLHKGEMRLAKEIDDGYKLQEKVQTMLEFDGAQTEMARIQREDAEVKLYYATKGRSKLGNVIVPIVSVVLAVATFLTAILIPIATTDDGGDPNSKPFKLTVWHYTSMMQLIQYVDDSPMHPNAKPTIKNELELLVQDVMEYDEQTKVVTSLLTRSEMTAKVKNSITTIDAYIEEFNTYKRIYSTFTSTQSEAVVKFAYGLRAINTTEYFMQLREMFDDKENFDVSAIALSTETFASEVKSSVNLATSVPTTDELYQAIITFATALENAVDTNNVYVLQQSAIDNAFTNQDAIANALDQQNESRLAINYVIAELAKIFEIKDPPPTGGESLPNIELGQDSSGNNNVSGAPGEGGNKYGSNEEIYYPDDQEHKKYGDVFLEYDAKKDEISNEENTPDDVKDIIDEYFDKLGSVSNNTPSTNP